MRKITVKVNEEEKQILDTVDRYVKALGITTVENLLDTRLPDYDYAYGSMIKLCGNFVIKKFKEADKLIRESKD